MPWVYTGKSFPKVTGEKLLKDNWVFLVRPLERGHTAACYWSIPTLAMRCITTSPLGLLMHDALSTIAVDFDSRNSMKTTESKLQLKRSVLSTYATQQIHPMCQWIPGPLHLGTQGKSVSERRRVFGKWTQMFCALCLHNSTTWLCVSTNRGILLMN